MMRELFPIFNQKPHGKRLCYLDSAASAQKPQQVLDAMHQSLSVYYANVHRGAYYFSEESTAQAEEARRITAQFISAQTDEIIFTSNATMSINLVALSYGVYCLKKPARIVLTMMEHHANIVPWQMLAERHGAILDFVPFLPDGTLDLEYYQTAVKNADLVAMTYVSNVLGTINPIKQCIEWAHNAGAKILIDGSQAAPHLKFIDVKDLDCDFLVFTGHKCYGPTGIGVLYGKRALLKQMPPVIGGGDMIERVRVSGTDYATPPQRFEAGTPNFVGAIGLGSALIFMNQQAQLTDFHKKEVQLARDLSDELQQNNNIRLIGTAPEKIGLVTFCVEGVHPHDVATLLDQQGVCVRAGLHCAEPLAEFLGINGSIRVSYGMYNDEADNVQFMKSLYNSLKILGVA